MRKITVLFIVLTLLIAGCGSNEEQKTEANESSETSESNQSTNNTEIVVAEAHKDQLNDEGIQKELEDVQKFFDENDFPYKDGTINFVILRGLYNNDKQLMTVVGVFVNNTGKTINGISGSLAFDFTEKQNAEFNELDFNFQPTFLGELENNQGFIIHIDVPTNGLDDSKDVYDATEITGEVSDMMITFADE